MFLKENITHNYTVYFDVDDTLSDYTGNLKSSGISPKDTAKDKDFWLNASVISGTQDLVKFCKDNFDNVEVLSAVPTLSKEKQEVLGLEFYAQATEGKEEWLSKNFGGLKCIWVKDGKSKNKYANENSILIDDKADNIKHWEAAGGIGILFDNPNNVKAKLQSLQKPLNEGFIPNDYQDNIKGLLMYAQGSGYNVEPFPKVRFIHDDSENAENFIGKTAYYDPNNSEVVLYTMGRDPIAIVNSFSHELIHHIQNLEGRLTDIDTENTLESEHLEKLEREAYENGGMLLRNYKDHLRKASELTNNMINEEHVDFKGLEKKLDDMLEPLGLDAEFTSHFKSRVIERHISEEDVIKLIEKIIAKYGEDIADIHKGDNKVFTDVRNLVDIAAVGGSYGDDYLKDLIFKTAYKRNSPDEPEFRTNSSSPKLKVDEDKYGLNAYMRELMNEVLEEKPKYQIYSDLDGVIADFDTQFKKHSKGIPPGEYIKQLGLEGFWDLIDTKIGLEFWTGIPWMSDGHSYWDYIKGHNPTILSAPSRNPVSTKGKKMWVKDHLPGTKLILAFADEKKKYAKPNHILIDDLKSNIEQWESKGGIGILHTSASETIKKLKELGL